MRFNGICIVTENVPRLCAFYRKILKLEPEEQMSLILFRRTAQNCRSTPQSARKRWHPVA